MRLLLIAALLLSACDEDDDDNPMDAAVLDTGRGPDGCALDNPARDGGVNLGPCNPANGTRCEVSSGRSCVWNFERDEGDCRCLGDAPAALGEPCEPENQGCAAGMACLGIGGFEPACYQVCTQTNPTECDDVSTPDTAYACFAIVRSDETPTRNFGLCSAVGARCDPLDDRCPASETCVLISTKTSVCDTSGTVPIGGDCTNEECAKGGVCVPLVDQNGNPIGIRCHEPCSLAQPACTAGSCVDVGIEGFGLCI